MPIIRVISTITGNWVRSYVRGNPLVENTRPYVRKFGIALRTGFIAMLSVILLAFVLFTLIVVGTLKGWL